MAGKKGASKAQKQQLDLALEVVTYDDASIAVNVQIDRKNETICATQDQMANLFGVSRKVISHHINNVYRDGELREHSTSSIFEEVRSEGLRNVERGVPHYNLDMIISVGFRVNSKRAVAFRQWAGRIIRDYAVQGYALNERRLKSDPEALNNLAAKVRQLRSDEKQIYQAVRDCFKLMASDYDPNSKVTRSFYARLQDKFLYAVTGAEAAEIVLERADHMLDHMGLTCLDDGESPTLQKAKTGKNYLVGEELYALHILCEQFLLFAESKALRRQTLTMQDMSEKFDELLRVQGHDVHPGYNRYKAQQAERHARQELHRWKQKRQVEKSAKSAGKTVRQAS